MGGYTGGGGYTSRGAGSLPFNAARAGLGMATGGTSEIIAQVLNIIPSIFQGITGASQLRKANRIEAQNPRPEAEIAPSINKLTDYSYGRTFAQDIPGGEMYRGEIKGATAAGMRAASELGSGSEAYGMLGQMAGREQNAFSDLARTTAQQVAGYQGDYMNALESKAQEENRVWDWNKAEPYLMAAQIARQLRDSGLRNINSGMKNVFGSAAEYGASMDQDFNSSILFGRGNNNGMGQLSLEDVIKEIKTTLGAK